MDGNLQDYVFVFSRTGQEHLQHLKKGLQLLREEQWYDNAQNCSCCLQKIKLLHFRVCAAGVQPDPANFEEIRIWHLSLYSRTDVQTFLGPTLH